MKIRCPSCSSVHSVSFELIPGQHVECSCGERFEIGDDTVVGEQKGSASEADTDLEEGVLIGRCRIERKIGKGAIGDVYLARHMTLDIPVAVKVLRERFAQQAEYKKRFYREARTAARMDHPNVVRVLDCGEDEGALYLVMEYMSGGTVRDLLDQAQGPLPAEQVLDMAVAVCRALTVARQHGIVHRDVKPDNIMVAEDGTYKLSDLGLAREMVSAESGLTVQFTGLGTPHYMAPEQAFDAGTADIRADIYSLGATLYHAACGRPPFQGKNTAEVLSQHARNTCAPPSRVNSILASGFDDLLGRAMMKRPERRYATPEEMLEHALALRRRVVRREKEPALVVRAPVAALASLLIAAFGIGIGFVGGRLLEAKRETPPATVPERGGEEEKPAPVVSQALPRSNVDVRLTVGRVVRDTGQGGILLELRARPIPGAASLSDGVVEFGGAVYDLRPDTEGGLRFSLPELPAFPGGETARMRVYDRSGRNGQYEIAVPQAPSEDVRVLPPLVTWNESDTVKFRWTPLRPENPAANEDSSMTVEIGWLTLRGKGHTELRAQSSPESGSVVFDREAFATALESLPRGTALLARFTLRRARPRSEGVAVEVLQIAEKRYEPDDRLLRYPLLPEEMRKWINIVREKGLPNEDKANFSQRVWRTCGTDCVDSLLDMVLLDNGPVCYWAAYLLAEIVPRDAVAETLEQRSPSGFDRKRLRLQVRYKLNRQPDDFPESFDDTRRALAWEYPTRPLPLRLEGPETEPEPDPEKTGGPADMRGPSDEPESDNEEPSPWQPNPPTQP